MKTTNKYCRVDFLLSQSEIDLILKADEYQHKDRGPLSSVYEIAEESVRAINIMNSRGVRGITKPLAFIRFNPDDFTVVSRKVHIRNLNRYKRLLDIITDISADSMDYLSLIYLYYDTNAKGEVEIANDPRFDASAKQFIYRNHHHPNVVLVDYRGG